MLACTDLWYDQAAGWDRRLHRGALRPDGRLVVTNRRILLYADQLTGCTDMPVPTLLGPQHLRQFTPRLLLAWHPAPSPAVFRGRYLELLEYAGYRVRPSTADKPDHAAGRPHVIVRDDRVVGLLMPMSPDSIAPALGDRTAR